MDLQGKTVLVTGAALRIGREIALDCAGRGADVMVHYNRSRKPALKLKQALEALGSKASLIRADFSSPHTGKVISRFLQDVDRQSNRIDCLINNASVFFATPFKQITERHWDELITVNLKVPFFLSQKIGMRMMRQKAGKIINLVDWSSARPSADYLPYGISKAGLQAATAGLAKVLAPYVQVNSIAPGPILPARGMTARQSKFVLQRTLLKRYGDPRDISRAVQFLIESDYVTGVCLPVDGGSSLV